MKKTTLCYIEKDGCFLMLLRNKKLQDPNEGKWLGIGGKIEEGETPDECMLREMHEETGLTPDAFIFHGIIRFRSDTWDDEDMYLYSAKVSVNPARECDEGTLRWIRKKDVLSLNLWEGDRCFLEKLLAGEREITMTLRYEGEKLTAVSDFSD